MMADAPKTESHTTTADIASIKFTLRDLIEEVTTLIWEKRQFITGKIERRQIGEPEKNLALLRIRRLEVLLAYLKAGNNPVAEPEAPRAKTAEELGRSEQGILRDVFAGRALPDLWTPAHFTHPPYGRICTALLKIGDVSGITFSDVMPHLEHDDARHLAIFLQRPEAKKEPAPEPPAEEPTIDLDDF